MDAKSPQWKLTMAVVGDEASRTSTLVVPRPYMGMGARWPPRERTVSWAEPPYQHLCINACWELYGASDRDHLPSSSATYEVVIEQPHRSDDSKA